MTTDSLAQPIAHHIPRAYQYQALLTPDGYSPKTDKGHARNVATAILYLAPSTASGVANVCVDASAGCISSCLYAAGRGGFDPQVPAARIERTKNLKFDRFGFNQRLIKETTSHRAKAGRTCSACWAMCMSSPSNSRRAGHDQL